MLVRPATGESAVEMPSSVSGEQSAAAETAAALSAIGGEGVGAWVVRVATVGVSWHDLIDGEKIAGGSSKSRAERRRRRARRATWQRQQKQPRRQPRKAGRVNQQAGT